MRTWRRGLRRRRGVQDQSSRQEPKRAKEPLTRNSSVTDSTKSEFKSHSVNLVAYFLPNNLLASGAVARGRARQAHKHAGKRAPWLHTPSEASHRPHITACAWRRQTERHSHDATVPILSPVVRPPCAAWWKRFRPKSTRSLPPGNCTRSPTLPRCTGGTSHPADERDTHGRKCRA